GGIGGHPVAPFEGPDDVSLDREERLLPPLAAVEKVVVRGVQKRRSGQLRGPGSPGLHHAQLRLDAEPVLPEIDELVAHVLPEGYPKRQPGPHDGTALMAMDVLAECLRV